LLEEQDRALNVHQAEEILMIATQTIAPTESGSRAVPRPVPQTRAGEQAPESLVGGPTPPEERERMIAQAAYFRAERRGFAPGAELDDWFGAETEIERLLAGDQAAEGVS